MSAYPDINARIGRKSNYYPGRWVAVCSYAHPAEAHIARQKLESEGIDAYLDNENLVATDWLLANATAGIKLMVREPDVPAADAVLRSKGTPELAIEPDSIGEEDYCEEDWRCSKCHRTDAELVPLPKVLVLLTLPLLCAPLLLLSRRCRCKSCGHEWRQ
jgi:hypothetical protein